jgi:acetyl esterase/lipase
MRLARFAALLVLLLLLVVSAVGTYLRWIEIADEGGWIVGMVAKELWPWLIVANLLGAALARWLSRWALPILIAGFAYSAYPLLLIVSIDADMARQWTMQWPGSDPPSPSIAGLLRRAFADVSRSEIPVRELTPRIALYLKAGVSGVPRPVLVNIHGGGWQQGSQFEDRMFSSALASRGYAVFSITYRRAPEHRHPAQIEDVREALVWIRENGRRFGADTDRLALAGHSVGSHLAMLAGWADPVVPIRSIVAFHGPSDLAAMYADPPSPDPLDVRAHFEDFIGGAPSEAADRYRDASPIVYIRRGLPPTLQLEGRRDTVVKPQFVRETHRRLLEAGSKALLLEIPWSGHSFEMVYFGPGSQLAMLYVDAFLRVTLE